MWLLCKIRIMSACKSYDLSFHMRSPNTPTGTPEACFAICLPEPQTFKLLPLGNSLVLERGAYGGCQQKWGPNIAQHINYNPCYGEPLKSQPQLIETLDLTYSAIPLFHQYPL